MPLFISARRIFLSSLAVPAATLLLAAFLRDYPLPASKSRTIKCNDNDISSTASTSSSLRIINPRKYQALTDHREIHLSRNETRDLSDTEILARFMKGFMNGWVITPERVVMGIASFFGVAIVPVGFTNVKTREVVPVWENLRRDSLPPPLTQLYGGNFLVLNYHQTTHEPPSQSFVELAYGDDRKGFAGMHRFEVSREEEEDGINLSYSSYTCNPSEDRQVFSFVSKALISKFHCFYALCLFRDGIREVMSG